ncbi:MAG TPA: T9SS type A sorting domain-containing protein [Patescibacteria group bacterium]|nr:T9SS type A sorting domain-containing protein [Patescibacteria group bacterium]
MASRTVAVSAFFLLLMLALAPEIGAQYWPLNGIPVCIAQGEQSVPALVPDGEGGAVLCWQDFRVGAYADIYAQRIDSGGNALWNPGGAPVCTAINYQGYAFMVAPAMVSYGDGGTIVVWLDQRPCPEYTFCDIDHIYAQRIDQDGNPLWAVDGVPVCTTNTNKVGPEICPTSEGGAIIVWRDILAVSYNTYAQRFDHDGNTVWAEDGVLLFTQGRENHIVPDGADGAMILYKNGFEDILLQRINAGGELVWPGDGVLICDKTGELRYEKIISDGRGGFIITWRDFRIGDYNIYAQRVDTSGTVSWVPGGVTVCGEFYVQEQPTIASDGDGGAIIAWCDTRNAGWDIYAQRIDAAGDRMWPDAGVAICATPSYNAGHQKVLPDSSGGAVIVYTINYDNIYSQKVDSSGNIAWADCGYGMGVPICKANVNQGTFNIISDDGDGAYVGWSDERDGYADVYATRIGTDGPMTDVLLRGYSVDYEESRILVRWTLAHVIDARSFLVYRLEENDDAHHEASILSDIQQEENRYTVIDEDPAYGSVYRYRVEISDGDGRRELFTTDAIAMPRFALHLEQNHPNPFNPSTVIRYSLPERQHVRMSIFDVSGKRVARLVDREETGGHHAVEWNGLDEEGSAVASGIYFYTITAGKRTMARKMILLR